VLDGEFRREAGYEKRMAQRALLLVGHGTIRDTAEVPEFLRRIRRGRPPSAELVAEIRRRYDYIGSSPLLRVTEALGAAIEAEIGFPVRVAMRFWHPFIEDVLDELVKSEVRELCVLPVAPFSVHIYVGAVSEALAKIAATIGRDKVPELVPVATYGEEPGLVTAHAAQIAPLLVGKSPDSTALVLTAHSLPVAVVAAGDPYQRHFEACARAVSHELGFPGMVAYQSQGEGGGDWLGPTVNDVLRDACNAGKRDVVLAPIGFLADHVETLYDLDVEAKAAADSLGIGLSRVAALNDSRALVDVMTGIARRAFP
jgi:protoporphyrin/coproporphyrin ferrochelatase